MHASMILAAHVLAIGALATAAAPPIQSQNPGQDAPRADQTGKCSGPDGKDAASVLCKGAGQAPGSGPAASGPVYRLDAKGVCRDVKGKMVKAELCRV